MRLRPFISTKDFDEIKNWITDERTHAMWCANRFKFPVEKNDFESVITEFSSRFGDSRFVATSDDGKLVGFFCYSLNLENNEGMFKFVMVNPSLRGQGYGKQMLKLALEYAFGITKAATVQLNVYQENTGARKCYESVGFVERSTTPAALTFNDESWTRCNMVISPAPSE